MTRLLFGQETWLIGVFVCSFVFIWRIEGCLVEITSNNFFCAVCVHAHVLSVLPTLGGEVGCSTIVCKSWLWRLCGYWKGRFLTWKAWLQKLCISSHFSSQTCLKMSPFHECTITCKLLIAQAARAVTVQCHWWQLLLYKMCWEFASWKHKKCWCFFGYSLVLLTLFLSPGKNNDCFVCLLKYSVIKTRACWLFCAFSLNAQIFVNLNSSGSR